MSGELVAEFLVLGPLLDWFHLTMRITVQLAKGLRVPPELSATLAAELQR